MMRSFPVRPARVFIILGIVFQICWYLLLGVNFVMQPGKLEGADFIMFYSVGRVAREYGLSHVYNFDLAASAQGEITNLPLDEQQAFPPNHPPFINPILAVLSGMTYHNAYIGYVLLMYAIVIVGFPAVLGMFMQHGWQRPHYWLACIGILLFEPLFISILKGQDSAILLLSGLLWFVGLLKDDERLAGLGLSLALIRPQIAIALAIPFLFRQRKIWWWFCVGTLILGLYSFLQIGWSGTQDYLNMLTLSASGEGYGMAESAMFNFTGLLLRLMPGLGKEIVHLFGWGLFLATLIGLCVLWKFTKASIHVYIAIAVTLSLFFSPHLHYHDLVLLLIPLLGLGLAGVRAGMLTGMIAASLPMLLSLLLIFCELWDPARYTVIYIIMGTLSVLTWLAGKKESIN